MRFSSIAVLAAVAPLANGFAPIHRPFAAPGKTVLYKTVGYDLDLGDEYKPKKKAPAPKPAPAPVAPAPVPAPAPVKFEKRGPAKKVEPAPVPVPPPAPVKAKKAAQAKVTSPPPPPAPVTAKKAAKAKVTPPPPPPPRARPAPVVSKDPNAVPTGVALGAAPLLLAPIVALGAGRSILQGTVARRERIQKEIADFEAAKRKKQVRSEVDGSTLATALVRDWSVFPWHQAQILSPGTAPCFRSMSVSWKGTP